ncbi:Aldo/keto reductase [Phellopilus nigrolimitatus]|nr:Aldo/keto reductase [Phellopilus nigrolimitatus]
MAASIPSFSLNDGNKIPSVGLGCWMGVPGGGDKVYKMVQLALKHGYRHIDTAFGYGNEEVVGKAIRESGIPREEIFVTTKLPQPHHGSVHKGFEISLKNLDIDYVDLYLMHWPQATNEKGEVLPPEESPTFIETWLEMEKLLKTGKVKSIGVSNFSIKTLDVLLPKANIIPAVNQVELHPFLPQVELKKYCETKGIILTAYSPFGQPVKDNMALLEEPIIGEIAKRTGLSVGQVLVSWAVQRGTVVIPKSEKEERIKQNITLVKLSDIDMKTLDELHLKPGMNRSLLARYIKNGSVFGWTFEQLGWNLNDDGFVV